MQVLDDHAFADYILRDSELDKAEWDKCARDFPYWVNTYIYILDAVAGDWIRFELWEAQEEAAHALQTNRLVVWLKARQKGGTWLCLAFGLWLMIFHPIASVAVWSLREHEAIDLLDQRLKGMYKRLPLWMQSPTKVNSKTVWQLANGSTARAFPTTAGDSYQFTYALIDEADLVPDLNGMLLSIKPTIEHGGRLTLLSKVNKASPASGFKNTFIAAHEKRSPYKDVFLNWRTDPRLDDKWYEETKAEILERTGSIDDLYENYPETVAEAIQPRTTDKLIPYEWLVRQFDEQMPSIPYVHWGTGDPRLPFGALTVYQLPASNERYVIGCDPAEGNEKSDNTALTVLCLDSGFEVASLAGKYTIHQFAAFIHAISDWYNNAGAMVERNNHGHAVLMWLADRSNVPLFEGHDGKVGWLSSAKGKAMLYNTLIELIHYEEVRVRHRDTYFELQSMVRKTLRAPDGMFDDRADSYALAAAGLVSAYVERGTQLVDMRVRIQ